MKLASYLIVRGFKYNIKYSVYFKGIYGLIIMGGTTVMMKSACILFSLCLGFSMTACEQRKEVKTKQQLLLL